MFDILLTIRMEEFGVRRVGCLTLLLACLPEDLMIQPCATQRRRRSLALKRGSKSARSDAALGEMKCWCLSFLRPGFA